MHDKAIHDDPSQTTNSPNPRRPAVDLAYRPRDPVSYRPPIALIGCGGIAKHHLSAYRSAGYHVAALCDVQRTRAEAMRDAFVPDARVVADYHELLRDDSIEVVDIATHPLQRESIIEAAVQAGKHVLSQKPFVLDLERGQRLADLADQYQVRLAVNQNARWAPHFAYTRLAIAQGLLGHLSGVHLSVHWDHGWVAGTPFEDVHDLILYDYAIHWFDIVNCFLTHRPALRVYASTARSGRQSVRPNLLAQALIEYDDLQVSLAFDGDTRFGSEARHYVAGSDGSISSSGPDNRHQRLVLTTAAGQHQPELVGQWFDDGFHGAMGELLCSIEENRVPTINAADNLNSLALCFAAIASAQRHEPVVPGSVRRLP